MLAFLEAKMSKITGKNRLIAFASGFAAIALVLAAAVSFNMLNASASANVVHDPKGDAISESGALAPGYLDVTKVKISEKKGSDEIVFSWNLGAPVPGEFGADDYIELGGLSLNHQLPTGETEYVVIVRWSEGEFEGVLIDYSNGFPPTSSPVDFDINGSTVRATVPSTTLGNPDSFTWISLSREKPFVRDNPFEGVTDAVPNDVAALPWIPGDDLLFENLGVWNAK